MRKIIVAVALALSAGAALAEDQQVNGYTKQNGTYVEPYHRSAPNNTTSDNYSTRGNTNPYTGAPGTRDPGYTRPAPSYTPSPNYNQPSTNPYGQHQKPCRAGMIC
jgi:hypothetical protein